MITIRLISLGLFACATLAASNAAAVTLNTNTYTQNFNGLASSGTGNVSAIGWLSAETGANANATYTAGTGSSNTGDTFSFGTNADRALGGLRSGNLIPLFGAQFTNNLGRTITAFDIAFTGELYRLGTANRGADTLAFQYSTDATSLTTGIYTGVAALNFTTPNLTGTIGVRNGNLAANQTALSASIIGLTLAQGQSLFIRFVDTDVTGADDGLAIDDFSLSATTAVPEPATWALMIAGFGLVGLAKRRTRVVAA
ncbi:PEPxxWA-CTERM sorting domain-containing protein [Glacieibacterium frigidum]|uniref:PEP-CTERM sorting domain-containing protein n=1 Tax=Glacieibacterium frigidum TaxID=2593303 RepID=A0A552U8W8_9SPHN|nr:PEPxxWA-CTERM sorting domain-containing protein [Glacieibacterium frigidum]TRW14674.1 PEP-CTERM sorting domain-containing protein [Glacieibacterium frigidum]